MVARIYIIFTTGINSGYHELFLKYKFDVCRLGVMVMVFNTTFSYISVISCWSVFSVKETGILRENHRPAKFCLFSVTTQNHQNSSYSNDFTMNSKEILYANLGKHILCQLFKEIG